MAQPSPPRSTSSSPLPEEPEGRPSRFALLLGCCAIVVAVLLFAAQQRRRPARRGALRTIVSEILAREAEGAAAGGQGGVQEAAGLPTDRGPRRPRVPAALPRSGRAAARAAAGQAVGHCGECCCGAGIREKEESPGACARRARRRRKPGGCRADVLDVVVPIEPPDFKVAFTDGGSRSMLQYLLPPPRRLFFLAARETQRKAEGDAAYRELVATYGSKVGWLDEQIAFSLWRDNHTSFAYSRVAVQVMKLSIFRAYPQLACNTMVADSDLRWLRPTQVVLPCGAMVLCAAHTEGHHCFVKEVQRGLKCTGNGVDFIEKLAGGLPGVHRPHVNYVGHICHWMVFQRDVMSAMHREYTRKAHVDEFYQVLGTGKWKRKDQYPGFTSGRVTEWELYAAYAISRFPERVVTHFMPWMSSGFCTDDALLPNVRLGGDRAPMYAACHSHRLNSNLCECHNGARCVNRTLGAGFSKDGGLTDAHRAEHGGAEWLRKAT
eukprot:TRINITY_DN15446_c0_g1_i1.p1 TRINITY_DN15446_c0_g1~~TRINITY_DN15446_c0_g1_i1.p1  ORF type:complete len:517 (+),score=105.87 TRINITY_DN15446_c0_g1_i1:77-1552(+)